MKKIYYFSANWRNKDVEFLNTLNLSNKITKGFDSFSIEEGKEYDKIINYYSDRKTFFSNIKPKGFNKMVAHCSFTKEELDRATYYMLTTAGSPKGYPQPEDGYEEQVFSYECGNYRVNRKQIAPFKLKKTKWNKNQVNFSLDWEWDCMFLKKEFYQEVLAPLGLKSIEVINYATGKPLEDTIQLDIPVAKSRLLIENSAYDNLEPCCGKKQYARQYLDFFPPFEKEFDFHICYTQEEFEGGFKRIIISKEFCQLLVKHKIIKYISGHIIPLKNN